MEIGRGEGAKMLLGGGPAKVSGLEGGFYIQPTIFSGQNKMRVFQEEIFGPALGVTTFKDEADAVRLANHTEHGLAAGVFTRDGARQLRMVKAIKAGIVWVNTYRVVSPIAAFGGMKNSGYGRESGLQAVYDYTRPKTAWINTSDEPLGNQFVAR